MLDNLAVELITSNKLETFEKLYEEITYDDNGNVTLSRECFNVLNDLGRIGVLYCVDVIEKSFETPVDK